jgi:hypothetical protein
MVVGAIGLTLVVGVVLYLIFRRDADERPPELASPEGAGILRSGLAAVADQTDTAVY